MICVSLADVFKRQAYQGYFSVICQLAKQKSGVAYMYITLTIEWYIQFTNVNTYSYTCSMKSGSQVRHNFFHLTKFGRMQLSCNVDDNDV